MSCKGDESRVFPRRCGERLSHSTQMAAIFLIAGIDLADALSSAGEERRRIETRLERLLERECLRGIRRHWGYDLNRHIALKQVLDRLRGERREPR